MENNPSEFQNEEVAPEEWERQEAAEHRHDERMVEMAVFMFRDQLVLTGAFDPVALEVIYTTAAPAAESVRNMVGLSIVSPNRVLSERDFAKLQDAIENPAPATEKMRALFRAYQKRTKEEH